MANATINLPLVKSGYVRQDYPTTVFPTSPSGEYEINDGIPVKRLYLGFSAFPANLAYNRLYSVRLRIQFKGWELYFKANLSDFDPNVLTYENAPSYASGDSLRYFDSRNSYTDVWAELTRSSFSRITSLFTRNAIRYGLNTWFMDNSTLKIVLSDNSVPYLEVTYDDSVIVASQITVNSAPSSGYVNPRNATAFSWGYEKTGEYYCAGTFTQASAALKWRVAGASTWNTVSASGATKSLTVPANTFPTASTIEWYLTGTDNAGTTSTTATYTFSTAAGTANADAVSPNGSVEDGSQPIVLNWLLGSTDGQAPAYVDLKWKTPSQSESQWTALLSHASARTSHIIPADTLPAGAIQWTVRAYNVDDVAGPWATISGDYPGFICVDAPDAPQGVTATSVPLTTVSWQATGQEAYEIQIDDETATRSFGPTVSSWQVPEPLADGTHVIRVRVQGVYGLWSAWSSATITVANTAALTLTISGQFGVDADLSLDIADPVPDVHWYRDGKQIALTSGRNSLTDRLVLGQHVYYAEVWHSNGNYSRSNSIAGTMKSCTSRIAELAGGSWIELKLSENSNGVQSFSWSRKNSLRHVRGSAWPVLELAPFENETGSYDCAFTTVEEMQAFESFKGRIVILKTRGGQVMVGALTSMQKRMLEFYISCTFTIQRIEYKDFIRYDQGA